jgi:hypothetical protein
MDGKISLQEAQSRLPDYLKIKPESYFGSAAKCTIIDTRSNIEWTGVLKVAIGSAKKFDRLPERLSPESKVLEKIRANYSFVLGLKNYTKTKALATIIDADYGEYETIPLYLIRKKGGLHPARHPTKREPIGNVQAKLHPNLKIVEETYAGYCNPCTILDIENDITWEAAPKDVVEGNQTRHPNFAPNRKLSEIEMLTKLQKTHPHITQLEGYKSSTDFCRFYDSTCGKWFETKPTYILTGGHNGFEDRYKGKSKEEETLYLYVLSLMPDTVWGLRDGRFSLDVYVPSKNIAFEYNGARWHSDEFKKRNYHINKTKLSESKGIRLIHIWDHEWIHNEKKIKSFIKSALGLYDRKLNARDCNITLIDKKTAKVFLNDYHLQGVGNVSTIKFSLGLYHEGELVGVTTYSNHHRGLNEILLSRLAFKDGVSVRGGLGKMTSFAKYHLKANIYTMCDLSKSNGNSYLKAGFDLMSRSKPDYFYSNSASKYISKQSRKKKTVNTPAGMTEAEHAKKSGLRRIWDCGKLKLIYRHK